MSVRGLRTQLAVLELGFEPLGVVIGAAVFQLYRPTSCTGFVRTGTEPLIYPTYEQGLIDLWTAGIGRLEQEAVDRGAHGVVGVTVSRTWHAGLGTTELQLAGAALRLPNEPPLDRPFLSTLSMGEFLKLIVSGWVPCGIAWGLSAVHVHGWAANPMSQGNTWSNAEMAAPTAGVQLARARAEQQGRQQLAEVRADGAVAMTVNLERFGQGCGNGNGMLIEGRVLGTGVARYRDPTLPVEAVRDLQSRGRHG